MKTTLLPTLLVFCGLLTACETDMLSEGRSELVVEGWIGHGEFPVVMLTHTLPVNQHYQREDYSKKCYNHSLYGTESILDISLTGAVSVSQSVIGNSY